MTTINISGVPEHFNLPWQLAIESGAFTRAGIALEWNYNKAGTGAMVKGLKEHSIDMAIVLTEGIVSAIINGLEARIVKPFITTPLIWGIHTGTSSGLKNIMECKACNYAISRRGSGSHLMAMIDAWANKRIIDERNFIEVSDIDGALKSLNENESQIFYWEKYTTKPLVDSGRLNRIGEFVTPWPCFMIAASNKALEEKGEAIGIVLEVINKASQEFVASPHAVKWLMERYAMEPGDATAWFYNTDWSYDYSISAKMLQNVMHALKKVGAIESITGAEQICADNLNLL